MNNELVKVEHCLVFPGVLEPDSKLFFGTFSANININAEYFRRTNLLQAMWLCLGDNIEVNGIQIRNKPPEFGLWPIVTKYIFSKLKIFFKALTHLNKGQNFQNSLYKAVEFSALSWNWIWT